MTKFSDISLTGCFFFVLFLNCRKKKCLMVVHANREHVVLCDMT